ncbi:MAG: hypothetical protein JSU85_14235, partial [Candidatus Zixiibacteriota bacterium]
ELSRIYQQQKRFKEAEKVLLELIEIESRSFFAMAELISIYHKTRQPEKCLFAFDTFLKETKPEKERKPQAMFNNIFKLCKNFERPEKAKDYYEKYRHILDDRNILFYKRLFEGLPY